MADLLADLHMRDRFDRRKHSAFTGYLKSLNLGEDKYVTFDYPSLTRIHDMNPAIYVTAILLIETGVPDSPEAIRETKLFASLIDSLGLQSSSKGSEPKLSHKASLVLLEVFTYMILIYKARSAQEETKKTIGKEQQELL